jgi:hypothetical protein
MQLRFQTRQWQRVRDKNFEQGHAFGKHLREIARPTQIAFQRLMASHQGEPIGVECRARTRDAWAFVMHEVSSPEYAYRLQYFDLHGFCGHSCYHSLTEAVESMLGEGYQTIDAGALDRCASTDQWKLSTKRLEFRLQFDRGLISYAEMVERMSAVTL